MKPIGPGSLRLGNRCHLSGRLIYPANNLHILLRHRDLLSLSGDHATKKRICQAVRMYNQLGGKCLYSLSVREENFSATRGLRGPERGPGFMTKAPAPFSGCIGPASILLLIEASARFYSCLSGANRLLLRLLVPLLARPPVGPAALHLALYRHTRWLRTLIPRLPTGRQFSCERFCSFAFS